MKEFAMPSPVLKWVGGKRQLMAEIEKHFPESYSTFYEPFVGGGAVLFHLLPKKAVVNDINCELINLYTVIKNDVHDLIEDLKKHKNESQYFYEVRFWDRDISFYDNLTDIQRASRILYLNKTCYNGLFRVNQSGQFNTPFGRYKNPNIVNESTLLAVSNYFNSAQIEFKNTDFTDSLKGIRRGSFVYFDPPYDPVSDSSNFTGYAKGGFDKSEQIRLKELCDTLDSKKIKFLLSNSKTKFIEDLYKEYTITSIKAKRTVNSNADGRGEVNEVLIKNY